jgi:predicted extracellular nuclease
MFLHYRCAVGILIVLLLSISLKSSGQQKQHEIIAIAFYNFENLFDTTDDLSNRGDNDFLPHGPYRYTKEIYFQKLHNLATVISQLGTDLTPDGPAIIGTAEIENDHVLRDICSQPLLKDRKYKFVHFDSRDSRGIDVALIYHPKYFQIIGSKCLSVKGGEHMEKSSRTRDILHVSGILASDTVHIFVNHWPSRRGGEAASASSRAMAASVCRLAVDSLTRLNSQTKIVIMGDLNDDPVNTSVTTVLGAKGKKEQVSPGELYNPFERLYKKGYGTLGYNGSWNLFDQIIISGSWLDPNSSHWKYYKAEVFDRPFLKYRFGQNKGYPLRSFEGHNWMNGYSDHFPSLIYLVREAPKFK